MKFSFKQTKVDSVQSFGILRPPNKRYSDDGAEFR